MSDIDGPELQYLLDRWAIRDCVYAYSHGVDRHDVEQIPLPYHRDAIDDHGRFMGTVPQFVEWVNGVHEQGTLGHQHNITTHLCEIDGDLAHTETYLLWALRQKTGVVMLGCGRYLDRMEKRDGKWGIALRRTVTDVRSECDAAVFDRIASTYPTGQWSRSDLCFQRPLTLPADLQARLGEPPAIPANPSPVRTIMTADDGRKALQYLLDRQAIIDCINTYCRALDRRDWELMKTVFHPDAVDNHGKFVGHVPEFLEFAKGAVADYAAHTHNTTVHIAEIDGDVAHSESYVILALRHKDGEKVIVGGARYIDRLERRGGEWRIALRRLIMDWRYTADGRVFNAGDGYVHGTWDRSDLSYMRPLELTAEQKAKLAARA